MVMESPINNTRGSFGLSSTGSAASLIRAAAVSCFLERADESAFSLFLAAGAAHSDVLGIAVTLATNIE
jgi:hypothetical protein